MSEPYLGEIRMFGGTFAPQGWALCDGQLLTISDNDALFSLLGTTYGGDGQTTFALPDLRGRVPVHQGQGPGLSNRAPGEAGGAEAVTLATPQLPAHTHTPGANSGTGTQSNPAGNVWAAGLTAFIAPGSSDSSMASSSVGAVGGGQPHENMLPFQAVNFIIALEGVFPSPN
jgi:microcystin-dependent protein